MPTVSNVEAFSLKMTFNSTPIVFDVPAQAKEMTIGHPLFLTIVGIGLVLNFSVIIVIGSARQLRYPRHLFWLFISLADCVFLVECLLEVAATTYKVDAACCFFVVLAGVDYSMLLVCLSLAALDRYFAIAHYEWYKKCVDNRAATLVTAGATSLMFLAMTSPYWLGYIPYDTCTVNLTLMFFDFAWDFVLGIACVVLHVLIFVKTRKLIQKTMTNTRGKPIAMRFVKSDVVSHPRNSRLSNRMACTVPSSQDIDDRLSASRVNTENVVMPFLIDQPDNSCFPSWFYSKNKFSRLEIRSAFSMSVNILPFWLCTFPVTVNVIAIYWCMRNGADCSVLFVIASYLCDMFLLHAIYNPIVYISGSSEFRRAVSHSLWKLKHSIY